MERLTEKDCYDLDSYKIEAKNLDYHCVGKDQRGYVTYYGQHIDKLAEYENLEDKGLLLRLPCKVGDTVWFVGNKFVSDYEVRRFIIDETGIDAIQVAKTINGTDYWNSFSTDDIGEIVFLTQSEAEQKLKEMESR